MTTKNTTILTKQTQATIIPPSAKPLIGESKPKHKDKIISTKKGIFNQILTTCGILITAAACGMPIGYSAILLPQLYNSSTDLTIDIEMGSWIASIHSLATPFGSFASGPFADRFGRKPVILFAIIPLIAGWIFISLAQSSHLILIGRILAGFSVGLTGPPAQVYLAEIAEPHIRGLLVGVPFVAYSLGILFVYALGSIFHWRTVSWLSIILPILSGVTLYFLPQSPVWLTRNGQLDKAIKTLTWLRGDSIIAKQEIQQLKERFDYEKTNQLSSIEDFFKTLIKRSTLKPLLIINIFNFLIIFSGTYLIVFYAIDIISQFSFNINPMNAAVVTALVRMLCTLIFCFLLLAIKRRTIIIISGLGSGLSCIILSIYMYINMNHTKTLNDIYFVAFCILTYIAFNTSFMVMPGIMIGELLPSKIRGRIAGYIFAIFHIATFCIAKIFPWITLTIKMYGLFLMFGLASLLAAIIMFLILPETKDRTLSEIEDYFVNQNWLWLNKTDSNNITNNDNSREV